MTPLTSWVEALGVARELARRANVSLSEPDSILLEKRFPEGTIVWTGGVRQRPGAPDALHVAFTVTSEHLTNTEADRISVLAAALYEGFFDAASDGLPLTSLAAVVKWSGYDVKYRYPHANKTFLDFATTYWTFQAIIRDLLVHYPKCLLTQLMDAVDGEIRLLFFPDDGQVAVDPRHRARDQARFLRRFAPRIDVTAFLAGNPNLLGGGSGPRGYPPGCSTLDVLVGGILFFSVAWILIREPHLLGVFIAVSIPVTAGSVALFWLALANDGFGWGPSNAPGIIRNMSLHIPAFVTANLLMFGVPIAAGVVYGLPMGVATFAFGRIAGRPIAFRVAKPYFR